MFVLFCAVTLFLLLYYILSLNNNYFEKRGVPHHKAVPILGNAAPFVLQRRHISEVLQELCDAFPKNGFFGYFDFWCPVYMVKDVELVKKICIKDFNHFVNHRTQFSTEHDPLFANSLFAMNDSRWRNMRTVLSPAFTGSKMRSMLELMISYCEKGVDCVSRRLQEDTTDLEMKDLFTKFSNDIIASCAFGIEVNSLENQENKFYINACALTRLNGIQGLKFLGYMSIPRVMKFLKIAIINKKMTEFYRNLIKSVVQLRETTKIMRPDMINLLMEAKNHQKISNDENEKMDTNFTGVLNGDTSGNTKENLTWNDDDLAAQCIVFLFAGFETVATLTSFMAHELAVNPSVQAKLRVEIDATRAKLNGHRPTYEVIQEMTYLDMVVTETLRKWPPIPFLDRRCTQPYLLEDVDGSSVQLQLGDSIWIPTTAIMRNPKYFPQPDEFDPERFSADNRGNIDPNTFVSFGVGPRNCIGSRFALMEAKTIFFYLLSKFTLEMGSKTQHPLELKANSITMQAKYGFWVKFRKRS